MTAFTIQVDEQTRDLLLAAARERSIDIESLLTGVAEAFAAEEAEPAHVWTAEERAGVEQGLAELQRGEGVPAEQVFANLRAKYAR